MWLALAFLIGIENLSKFLIDYRQFTISKIVTHCDDTDNDLVQFYNRMKFKINIGTKFVRVVKGGHFL